MSCVSHSRRMDERERKRWKGVARYLYLPIVQPFADPTADTCVEIAMHAIGRLLRWEPADVELLHEGQKLARERAHAEGEMCCVESCARCAKLRRIAMVNADLEARRLIVPRTDTPEVQRG